MIVYWMNKNMNRRIINQKNHQKSSKIIKNYENSSQSYKLKDIKIINSKLIYKVYIDYMDYISNMGIAKVR